jgi:hypothetical protein
MSQQIIEAEYGNKTFYFKVPEGRKIEDAYGYYVEWLKLHIQWKKGEKYEEISYFNETVPDYKNPIKVNIYTKEFLKENIDWLFSDDETECEVGCDCVNCEEEREA